MMLDDFGGGWLEAKLCMFGLFCLFVVFIFLVFVLFGFVSFPCWKIPEQLWRFPAPQVTLTDKVFLSYTIAQVLILSSIEPI